MEINFLKAEHGDCIYIKECKKNVIIDLGPRLTDEIIELFKKIKEEKEFIDLLVITHYDDDHIGGALRLFKSDYINLVKQVWFNGDYCLNKSTDQHLSKMQQTELSQTLSNIQSIKWIDKVSKDMLFDFPSPSSAKLKVMYSNKFAREELDGEMTSGPRCDWECTMDELDTEYLDGAPDKSISNADSIIIIAECGEHRILLPGDATPETLEKALNDYNEEKPFICDLMKLPHHGSYRNVSESIIRRLKCPDFVISTNGERFNHPDKRTLLKICKFSNENGIIRFHFNYWDALKEKIKFYKNDLYSNKYSCDGVCKFFYEG